MMAYRCVATRAIVLHWFPEGVTAAVALAPALFYNRSDALHSQYLRPPGMPEVAPHHDFPRAGGFATFAKAEHAYGVLPEIQISNALKEGNLVEHAPGSSRNLPLCRHGWNVQTPLTNA